jgi:hypothetical protein
MCFEGGPKFIVMGGAAIHEPDTEDVVDESVVE